MTLDRKKLLITIMGLAGIAAGSAAALAQEVDEAVSAFTRIDGGAVYDLKYGVDGSAVDEEFILTHVVCSDGSKSLRVMLPASPEDEGTVFSSDGPDSTLIKLRSSYRVTFKASGKTIRKTMELRPVNDPKSLYERQFVVRVDYGDVLWKALTAKDGDAAVMLIGQGGMPVAIPEDPKLEAALKSCGLPVSSS
jgi:hypothetical protein